jgi:hypothetical protein
MFPPGTPNLIKVPACRDCNGDSSGDDEYFASAVALKIQVSNNPVVNQLLAKLVRGIWRSRGRGNTGSIAATMKPIELRSTAGLYLGETGTFVPEQDRMVRAITRYVRGLYYHEFGARLPDTHEVDVHLIEMLEPNDGDWKRFGQGVQKLADFALSGKRVIVHQEVFYYAVNALRDTDGSESTVWIMQFYRHSPTLCITMPRDRRLKRKEPGS